MVGGKAAVFLKSRVPSPEILRQGRGAESQCRGSAKAREGQNGRATAEGSPLPHHTQVGHGVQLAREVVAISVSRGPSRREFEHGVVYKVLCEACKRDVSGATSDKWRGPVEEGETILSPGHHSFPSVLKSFWFVWK